MLRVLGSTAVEKEATHWVLSKDWSKRMLLRLIFLSITTLQLEHYAMVMMYGYMDNEMSEEWILAGLRNLCVL